MTLTDKLKASVELEKAKRKPKPSPGIYYGVPFDEYAEWEAWNPSTIKVLLSDSPMAMQHTRQWGRESTDSMDLGRAAHCCVFEPATFHKRFVLWEGGRRAGKAWDEFCTLHADHEILTADDFAYCMDMAKAVMRHESSRQLLEEPGDAEVSIVWTDPGTGLLCKGRVDWLTRKTRRLPDLKTAADPKPFPFITQATKLMYHVSMGAYQCGLRENGIEIESAHFIAVGNKPWHDVVRYDIADSALRHGRKLWHQGLNRANWCIKNDSWPGFSAEPYPFELPAWAAPDDEADAMSTTELAATNEE